MGAETMGKVVVAATIETLEDLDQARMDLLTADEVRRIEVSDAVVNTGATTRLLPRQILAAPGSSRAFPWLNRKAVA